MLQVERSVKRHLFVSAPVLLKILFSKHTNR
jgi:hypothetical protein